MKKTVIQSLINDIEVISSRKVEITMKGILTILENCLEDEKKQIMNAFEEGMVFEYEREKLGKIDYPALRYFNGTFENSDKNNN